uniref:Uncharacterized protein n=1 Tax=Anaerobacillus isosaccharinicus TaxID=1532552 RepID=A0A1S2MAQ5_9BACI|nr:hypothetical protein [Anaerobacillus isosaccharinicus]MBA5587624.1 hypothetical protein [Anaerobacillus isosaccharinicus]QOY34200.1 hypothetical protein AWH56_015855 [Anaerobacillus isosaccharinicus]
MVQENLEPQGSANAESLSYSLEEDNIVFLGNSIQNSVSPPIDEKSQYQLRVYLFYPSKENLFFLPVQEEQTRLV